MESTTKSECLLQKADWPLMGILMLDRSPVQWQSSQTTVIGVAPAPGPRAAVAALVRMLPRAARPRCLVWPYPCDSRLFHSKIRVLEKKVDQVLICRKGYFVQTCTQDKHLTCDILGSLVKTKMCIVLVQIYMGVPWVHWNPLVYQFTLALSQMLPKNLENGILLCWFYLFLTS